MEKAIEWVKNHKPHTAVIVIVVVAVIAVLIAAASGAFTQQDKTKDAIENGDETLKGDAGTGILNKLDGNVNANPNVSDETKENASKADEGVDVDGKPADTIGKPAHQHSWKQHTAQKWVSNMVTVPDYETQKVYGARFYVPTDVPGQYIAKGPEYWFENGFTRDDLNAIIYNAMKNADENGLYNGVSYSSYQNITKNRAGSGRFPSGRPRSLRDLCRLRILRLRRDPLIATTHTTAMPLLTSTTPRLTHAS